MLRLALSMEKFKNNSANSQSGREAEAPTTKIFTQKDECDLKVKLSAIDSED